MLTQKRVKELLTYNQYTGVFRWRVKKPNTNVGMVAGCSRYDGRRLISLDGKLYLSSRLAWLYMTGKWPANQIDHKNCVRNDDKFSNLRDVDGFTNQQNQRRAHKGSKSGFLGVNPSRDGYESKIMVNGKSHWLGSFKSASKARDVYLMAKRKLHEGCTI